MIAPHSREAIERVHRAIEDIAAGKIVIVVDDEHRENEGDFCCAAEHATPAAINFMATYGRGLICLALEDSQVRKLELPMMVDDNRSRRETAFTVSIEARDGITTGISAADRSHTIRTAVSSDASAQTIVSPGHVFPLRAKPGGVLRRTGHTEGAVDLARLAGCRPAGVICEIMNDDGTMARYDDLLEVAETHGLRVISIADLVEYRLQTETLVRCVEEGPVRLGSGAVWTAKVFEVAREERQFLALTHGEVDQSPVLVRVQASSVLGDVFGATAGARINADVAVRRIEAEGKGVLLFIPGQSALTRDLRFHVGAPQEPSQPIDRGEVLREFGLGAQVLASLGLNEIRLLTNRPRHIVGLEGFGLHVVDQVPLDQSPATVEITTRQ